MRYRITKYNPAYRDMQGVYQKDEWTSISDIGEAYLGKELMRSDYLAVENHYLSSIYMIRKIWNCEEFIVESLEKVYTLKEITNKLTHFSLPIRKRELIIFETLASGSLIHGNDIETVAQMVLRELLWCKLVSVGKCITIEFGYDYYMYVDVPCLSMTHIAEIGKLGLFVEKAEQ